MRARRRLTRCGIDQEEERVSSTICIEMKILRATLEGVQIRGTTVGGMTLKRGIRLEGDLVEMVVLVEGIISPEALTLTLGQGVGDTREGWMKEMVRDL
jgi:hypothetical protein